MTSSSKGLQYEAVGFRVGDYHNVEVEEEILPVDESPQGWSSL